jgi:hypothetical protein
MLEITVASASVRTMESKTCGVPVKTVDNSTKPCLREKGHKDGHNPFSDTPPVQGK